MGLTVILKLRNFKKNQKILVWKSMEPNMQIKMKK